MIAALRSGLGRLNLTLLGLALFAGTFWFTDRITNRQPPAPHLDQAHVAAAREAHPSNARVFVYIIDSLRHATAVDPGIMPNLAALRTEAASGEMVPGFNSSTVASLRNAFTGRENAAIFAVVGTFIHRDSGVESLFHQMALQGLTTAAYSEGSFRQFGDSIAGEVDINVNASEDEQDAHILAAAEALGTGRFNCIIGHLFYTDHVSHQEGVGTPIYRETFRRADALIPLIRAKLPAGATLVVTGDHGHDLKGRHGIALDVPTLGVYAGPAFRAGVDFGVTPVMTHRYLLSQALGLPVTTDAYKGDALPEALVSPPAPLPSATVDPAVRTSAWLVWIYLSFLGALWLNLVARSYSPLNFSGGRALALWAGVAPFLVSDYAHMVAGICVSAGLLGLFGWKLPLRSLLLWVGLPLVAGIGFQGWGYLLVTVTPWLETLTLGTLAGYWLIVVAMGAVLATRARRPWIMAAVFAVPAFFFHPISHHYGFPGTLAPLITCWFVFYTISLARDGVLREPGAIAKLVFAAAALFLMLQPFAASTTSAGIFARWHALVPAWDAKNTLYLLIPSVLAKVLLFFPRRPQWSELVLGILFIGFIQLIEARFWIPDAPLRLQLSIVLLIGWTLGTLGKRPEARLCGLCFCFLLYFSFVALTPRNFMEITVMIGALAVCSQVIRWFPQRENIRADYLTLALFGLIITGWAAMRWSSTNLEWHAIYELAAAATVEGNVGWFIPWIALKGLLPWVIILLMLRDRLGSLNSLPARELLILFSAKAVALLMLSVGSSDIETYNRGYLETACVVGAIIILYPGVILLPRVWPGLPPAGRST